jgi:hypothetical protein
MKATTILISTLCLGSIGVAATLFTSGVDPNAARKANEKKSRKQIQAEVVNELSQEMLVRFHDRNNLDFGFERIVRENGRLHRGPMSGKRGGRLRSTVEARQVGNTYEYKDPESGTWVNQESWKETFQPENDAEAATIARLREANMDVAFYTFSEGMTNERRRGPGYTRQLSNNAPVIGSLEKAIAKARLTQKDLNSFTSVDGWLISTRRVRADHEDCVKCHNEMNATWDAAKQVSIPAKNQVKIGDTLGILVLAVENNSPKH